MLLGCLVVFRVVWKIQNDQRFDNKTPSNFQAISLLHADLRILFCRCSRTIFSVRDRQLFSFLGISAQLMRNPHIIQVWWHHPLTWWIKVNIYGLSKRNSGDFACGRVFCNDTWCYVFGFGMKLGYYMSFVSKLYGVILVLEKLRGWSNLWLETDSRVIVDCLSKDDRRPPWFPCTKWCNCMSFVRSIFFFFILMFIGKEIRLLIFWLICV